MKHLDYSVMPLVLDRFFSGEGISESRRAGPSRRIRSDYFDVVRFFGDQRVDPEGIHVDRLAEPFRFRDERIASFAVWAARRLKREGRLYRGPQTTKVVRTEFECKPLSLTVQPCDYGQQAGSCFALDTPHDEFGGRTLRDYYLERYASRAIEDNPLAVCLGVCGLVLTNEQEHPSLLLVRRAGHLASLEDSIGPSAAGSVDWEEQSGSLSDLARTSLEAELREELGLEQNRYALTLLAWAREIFRGERPQLFCLVRVDMNRNQLRNHMDRAVESSDEVDSFELVRLENRVLSRIELDRLNHEARMNWWLVSEWLAERD